MLVFSFWRDSCDFGVREQEAVRACWRVQLLWLRRGWLAGETLLLRHRVTGLHRV